MQFSNTLYIHVVCDVPESSVFLLAHSIAIASGFRVSDQNFYHLSRLRSQIIFCIKKSK